jgi:hypothetical protein
MCRRWWCVTRLHVTPELGSIWQVYRNAIRQYGALELLVVAKQLVNVKPIAPVGMALHLKLFQGHVHQLRVTHVCVQGNTDTHCQTRAPHDMMVTSMPPSVHEKLFQQTDKAAISKGVKGDENSCLLFC